jgi:hypothetical protein
LYTLLNHIIFRLSSFFSFLLRRFSARAPHQVLDESIALYKQGYQFMPVVGATAVVEACLMSENRRKKKHDTLKERFEHHVSLYKLIKGADPSKIPIAELLDEDETLHSIINGEQRARPESTQ